MKKFLAGLSAGVATAAAARGESLVPWPNRVRTAFPGVMGLLAGVTTVGLSSATRVRPKHVPVLALGAVALGGAGWFIGKQKIEALAAESAERDPGLQDPPTSPWVSGGPGSFVDYSLLGREGARFVHSVSTDSSVLDIPRVCDPIRVFVSVLNAPTIEDRVDLALEELRRLNAFDREFLLIQAPAGSGYANSTPVDVLELLSGGNCATVVVSYGLLPSFLSINKVQFAGQTQRALLDAVTAELESRNRQGQSVPTVLLYGESLGAKVLQYAIPLGLVDLDRHGISRALWVGTPGGLEADGFHQLCAPDSITLDRPEQLEPGVDARVWFLEHDGDPVVRFRRELTWASPAWLTEVPRGRNIPDSMSWSPFVTWATVLVDTIFATDVKPGDFQSLGHDYRADLGTIAARAFGFDPNPDQLEALESQLRHNEVARAQRIG